MTTHRDIWHNEAIAEALEAGQQARLHTAPHPSPPPATDEELMTFIVSDSKENRLGNIVETAGWQLEPYRRNPIVLWAHQASRPTIGKATHLWVNGDNLMATIEFAPTRLGQETETLYRGGFLQGVSAGYTPLTYELRKGEGGRVLGIHTHTAELLEISAAPVPASADTIRAALQGLPFMAKYYQDPPELSRVSDTLDINDILTMLQAARE